MSFTLLIAYPVVVLNFGSFDTGERGVGIGKVEYLEKELGKGTVDLMRSTKKTIDPYNIVNPGKVCHFQARRFKDKRDNRWPLASPGREVIPLKDVRIKIADTH